VTAGGYVIKDTKGQNVQLPSSSSFIKHFLLEFKTEFPLSVSLFLKSRTSTSYRVIYDGMISCTALFIDNAVFIGTVLVLIHGVLNLLLSVPLEAMSYAKFTIVYTMRERIGGTDITYTLGPSISLMGPNGVLGITLNVLTAIIKQVLNAESVYNENHVRILAINLYYEKNDKRKTKIQFREDDQGKLEKLMGIVRSIISPIDREGSESEVPRKVGSKKRKRLKGFITSFDWASRL